MRKTNASWDHLHQSPQNAKFKLVPLDKDGDTSIPPPPPPSAHHQSPVMESPEVQRRGSGLNLLKWMKSPKRRGSGLNLKDHHNNNSKSGVGGMEQPQQQQQQQQHTRRKGSKRRNKRTTDLHDSSTSNKNGAGGYIMSPQEFLDGALTSRGYSVRKFHGLNCGYFRGDSTEYQEASYGNRLAYAIRFSDQVLLRRLLVAGLSPNPCSIYGDSVIHSVCNRGDLALLKALLEHGATVSLCDKYGKTPLHDVCWRSSTSGLASGNGTLPRFDIVTTLLSTDPFLVRILDVDGKTPLEYIPKEQYGVWNSFLEQIINEFWPPLESPSLVLPALVRKPPSSVPILNPTSALTVDTAILVSNGVVEPEKARFYEQQQRQEQIGSISSVQKEQPSSSGPMNANGDDNTCVSELDSVVSSEMDHTNNSSSQPQVIVRRLMEDNGNTTSTTRMNMLQMDGSVVDISPRTTAANRKSFCHPTRQRDDQDEEDTVTTRSTRSMSPRSTNSRSTSNRLKRRGSRRDISIDQMSPNEMAERRQTMLRETLVQHQQPSEEEFFNAHSTEFTAAMAAAGDKTPQSKGGRLIPFAPDLCGGENKPNKTTTAATSSSSERASRRIHAMSPVRSSLQKSRSFNHQSHPLSTNSNVSNPRPKLNDNVMDQSDRTMESQNSSIRSTSQSSSHIMTSTASFSIRRGGMVSGSQNKDIQMAMEKTDISRRRGGITTTNNAQSTSQNHHNTTNDDHGDDDSTLTPSESYNNSSILTMNSTNRRGGIHHKSGKTANEEHQDAMQIAIKTADVGRRRGGMTKFVKSTPHILSEDEQPMVLEKMKEKPLKNKLKKTTKKLLLHGNSNNNNGKKGNKNHTAAAGGSEMSAPPPTMTPKPRRSARSNSPRSIRNGLIMPKTTAKYLLDNLGVDHDSDEEEAKHETKLPPGYHRGFHASMPNIDWNNDGELTYQATPNPHRPKRRGNITKRPLPKDDLTSDSDNNDDDDNKNHDSAYHYHKSPKTTAGTLASSMSELQFVSHS